MLTARHGDNFGQYAVRGGLIRAMLGVVVLQFLLLPMAGVTFCETLRVGRDSLFAYPAYISILLAVATAAVSWYFAWESAAAVRGATAIVQSWTTRAYR